MRECGKVYTGIAQGSDEWKEIRRGKVTASRVPDVCARTKSGYGASRARYMAELVMERLSSSLPDRYVSAEMQHGIDQEPSARVLYEGLRDTWVDQVAFVDHPTILHAGASPDGLTSDDGLVEIKCPATHTHLGYLLDEKVPADYYDQMQWQMACTGRYWCDFVSYDPRVNVPGLRLWVARVVYDADRVEVLEDEVRRFLEEVARMEHRLIEKGERNAVVSD